MDGGPVDGILFRWDNRSLEEGNHSQNCSSPLFILLSRFILLNLFWTARIAPKSPKSNPCQTSRTLIQTRNREFGREIRAEEEKYHFLSYQVIQPVSSQLRALWDFFFLRLKYVSKIAISG
jgi:hypothetical protein